MKKTLNIFYIVLVVIGWVWLSGYVLMRVVLPWEVSQRFVEEKITQAVGTPVHIGRVGLRWSGLSIKNLQIDTLPTEDTTAAEPFVTIQEIRLYWSPWALLVGSGHIYLARVKDPTVYITRQEDGRYNFESLLPAENPKETAAEESAANTSDESAATGANHLFIKHLQITNGSLVFVDKPQKREVSIKQIFAGASNVSTEDFFPFHINAAVSYQEPGIARQEIKGGLALRAHLKEMNLAEAEVRLKQLVLSHRGGRVALEGRVRNFKEPKLSLHLSGADISEKIMEAVPGDKMAFLLERLDAHVQATVKPTLQTINVNHGQVVLSSATVYSADLKPQVYIPRVQADIIAEADGLQNQVTVSSFTVSGLSSYIFARGEGKWGAETHFHGQGNWDFDLVEIGRQMPLLQPYQLAGRVQGQTEISDKNYSGQLTAKAVGATVPSAGTLSDIEFTLEVPDKDHAQIKPLRGKINQGEFTVQAQAARSKRELLIDIKAHSPRVALPSRPSENAAQNAEPEKEEIPQLPQEKSANSLWAKLPPIKLQTEVDITSLDAPYIYGQDMALRIDMAGIDPSLSKAQGTLSFQMGRGEIKDLAQLTDSNILTGILFGSLEVVGRVVNSLNVFSVLGSLASSEKSEAKTRRKEEQIVQTVVDEQGREVNILVPYTAPSGNIWKFESFQMGIGFNQGLATIENGMFISNMMSFNLTGDMDFKTRDLDMNVQAAPGRHEEDGVMPLTLHIGGTMEDPQGSMRLVSSLTSFITQSVGNNFASRSAKKGISSFFNLFKKQKKEESDPDTTDAADASNAEDK